MVLLGLIAVTFFGYLLTKCLHPALWQLERIALGYMIGLGLFTYCLFLANLVGIPYQLQPASYLLGGLISVTALLWLVIEKTRSPLKKPPLLTARLNKWEWLFLSIIGGLVGLAFFSSIYWPVKDWDSLVLYDFRAKTFVTTGFMDNGIAQGYFFGYPLLVSLAHTWVYLLGFEYPGVIHSLFYVSFLSIFYASLRQRVSRFWALFWTAWLAAAPEMFGPANMTYTNLAYSVYLVSGFLYLLRWVDKPQWRTFWLSLLLVGLSTWTRSSEPFWLLVVGILLVVAILKRTWLQLILYPIGVYAFIYPWATFERHYLNGANTHLENAGRYVGLLTHVRNLANVIDVVVYFFLNVIKPSWPLYLILVLLTYLLWVIRQKAKLSELAIALLIWGGVGMTFLGIFLFSLFFPEWRSIGGSAQRMTIFFTPLILYFVAVVTHIMTVHLGLWKKQAPGKQRLRGG